jgi:hypothetical protein
MTGPEHYRAAEAHLVNASNERHDELTHLAYAQVHATLALAAATALGLGRADDHGMLSEDANAWQNTAGVPLHDGGAE